MWDHENKVLSHDFCHFFSSYILKRWPSSDVNCYNKKNCFFFNCGGGWVGDTLHEAKRNTNLHNAAPCFFGEREGGRVDGDFHPKCWPPVEYNSSLVRYFIANWKTWRVRVDSEDICHLTYILRSSCQLHYYIPTVTHPPTHSLLPCLESSLWPSSLSFRPSVLLAHTDLLPAASRCFWVTLLAGEGGWTIPVLFFSSPFSASAANFLWRADSCQKNWVSKSAPTSFFSFFCSNPRNKVCPFNSLVFSQTLPQCWLRWVASYKEGTTIDIV